MAKLYSIVLFFTLMLSHAQQGTLPVDLRQHNLSEYNSSLLSPVFSLDGANSSSIALWTRWQWQSVDGDPTTLFFNYTGKLGTASAIGAGFFQHNTGTFLRTGAVFNYAYSLNLGTGTQLALGFNLFGFRQELADDRFQPDPNVPLPQLEISNDFIVQLAPGIRFTTGRFSIGMVSENLFDYNFSNGERQSLSADRTYFGMVSYDFPLELGNLENVTLRPMPYFKRIPGEDTQFGLNTLLSTSKFWAQAGYNSFYGISGGAGIRFFKKLSVGALMEFGTDPIIDDKDPTFEIITAYSFGKQDLRKKVVGFDVLPDEEITMVEEAEKVRLEDEKIKEELAKAEALAAEKEAQKRAGEARARDSIVNVQKTEAMAVAKVLEEQKRLDSINNIALAAAETAKRKAELDKIAEREKAERPRENEKYEEVATEDGLGPGYYLIANVFGTKKYFDSFMGTLRTKGLRPKSFFRSLNKYNYVYLERYDTMQEARNARDSKFNGRYPDKTWIFRVVGN